MARAKSRSKVIFYLIWFKPGLSGRSKKYSTLASTSTRVYLLITVVHAGICFVRITSIFLLFASLILYNRANTVEQITHLSSCGERNIRQSLISLSSAPNRNCPPKARHSAGRMDAGFFSSSGLKFTLADVLRYVAFVPLDLVNQNPHDFFFSGISSGKGHSRMSKHIPRSFGSRICPDFIQHYHLLAAPPALNLYYKL